MVSSPKISKKYFCEYCEYKCSKQSEFNKHLLTSKHKILQNPTSSPVINENKTYNCYCGKVYKHASTLYAHKKKCNEVNKMIVEPTDKELIIFLIKENTEMKSMMMEVIKNGSQNTINNINNSHNKSFNIQFFLNETCKDAMNINDFVDSIKLQLSDLEKVGEIGYVAGISNIIIKNLNSLDETERPIHCTDNKREIMYVKDENKWEKEPENKQKIRKAIKRIANKNVGLLQEFKELHPDCIKSESKFSDHYHKLIIETFGGSGDNDTEKEDKIIKNIAKEVKIEK